MQKDVFAAKSEELKNTYYPTEACARVSASGLSKASTIPPENDEDKVAALSAATFAWAAKIAFGSVEQVFLKTAGDCVLMNSAESDADLSVVARSCEKCREVQNPQYCINALLNIR